MRNFVIAVDGVPAPDLGIFSSMQQASRYLGELRRKQNEYRFSELTVVAYARKRYRRAAAAA